APRQRFRLRMTALLLITGGQIIERAPDVGMAGRKLLLRQRECALEQRLGLGIAKLALIERGKIVQFGRDIDGLEPDRLLHDGKRALVERLGVPVAADVTIKLRQVVESGGKVAAGRALVETSDHRLGKRDRLAVFAGAAERVDLRALRGQPLCERRRSKTGA